MGENHRRTGGGPTPGYCDVYQCPVTSPGATPRGGQFPLLKMKGPGVLWFTEGTVRDLEDGEGDEEEKELTDEQEEEVEQQTRHEERAERGRGNRKGRGGSKSRLGDTSSKGRENTRQIRTGELKGPKKGFI